MRVVFLRLFLFALAYLTISLTFVSTLTNATDLPNTQSFRIGIEDGDFFPYFKTNDTGFEGIARDLLDKLAEDLGVQFIYQPMPARRLARALDAGTVDFIFPDNSQRHVAKKSVLNVKYSQPLITLHMGTYVLSPKSRLEDHVMIGTLEGVGLDPFTCLVDFGEIEILRSNDLTGLLRRTLTGSIDGIYIDHIHLQYLLRNLHSDTALVLDDAFPSMSEYLSLSGIRDREFLERVDHWIITNANEITGIVAVLISGSY